MRSQIVGLVPVDCPEAARKYGVDAQVPLFAHVPHWDVEKVAEVAHVCRLIHGVHVAAVQLTGHCNSIAQSYWYRSRKLKADLMKHGVSDGLLLLSS
jgi:hypothetical protein